MYSMLYPFVVIKYIFTKNEVSLNFTLVVIIVVNIQISTVVGIFTFDVVTKTVDVTGDPTGVLLSTQTAKAAQGLQPKHEKSKKKVTPTTAPKRSQRVEKKKSKIMQNDQKPSTPNPLFCPIRKLKHNSDEDVDKRREDPVYWRWVGCSGLVGTKT